MKENMTDAVNKNENLLCYVIIEKLCAYVYYMKIMLLREMAMEQQKNLPELRFFSLICDSNFRRKFPLFVAIIIIILLLLEFCESIEINEYTHLYEVAPSPYTMTTKCFFNWCGLFLFIYCWWWWW